MIITIAGIKRSGSTLQYNIVRIACEQAGYRVTTFGHKYQPKRPPAKNEVHLIKRHPYDADIARKSDHIFLTDRNDEDILKSLSRFNGKPADPKRIGRMRKHLDKWKQHTDLMYHYEDLQADKMRWINGIIEDLGFVAMNPFTIQRKVADIVPPAKGQDPETLLFHNHITSE